MRFRDRHDAGLLLAHRLERYRAQRPVVLGIPRGGMPVAAVVAQHFGADVDVMLVRKLRVPFQPELAFGSMDETGRVYLTRLGEDLAQDHGVFQTEKAIQLNSLQDRRRRYSGSRPPLSLAGRTVILVDDGLATGATAIAAVRSARARGARWVVVAIAVAPKESLALVRREADDVECLFTPSEFHGVREFFAQFPVVTDEDVVQDLREAHPAAQPRG